MIRRKKLIGALAFICATVTLSTSVTYAATEITGTSSGGSLGKAYCIGKITTSQGGLFSNDSVTAYTQCDAVADEISVKSVVWYNDGNSEVYKAVDKDGYNMTGKVEATAKAPNDYANKGTGGHYYSSSKRGTWGGGTSKQF